MRRSELGGSVFSSRAQEAGAPVAVEMLDRIDVAFACREAMQDVGGCVWLLLEQEERLLRRDLPTWQWYLREGYYVALRPSLTRGWHVRARVVQRSVGGLCDVPMFACEAWTYAFGVRVDLPVRTFPAGAAMRYITEGEARRIAPFPQEWLEEPPHPPLPPAYIRVLLDAASPAP